MHPRGSYLIGSGGVVVLFFVWLSFRRRDGGYLLADEHNSRAEKIDCGARLSHQMLSPRVVMLRCNMTNRPTNRVSKWWPVMIIGQIKCALSLSRSFARREAIKSWPRADGSTTATVAQSGHQMPQTNARLGAQLARTLWSTTATTTASAPVVNITSARLVHY